MGIWTPERDREREREEERKRGREEERKRGRKRETKLCYIQRQDSRHTETTEHGSITTPIFIQPICTLSRSNWEQWFLSPAGISKTSCPQSTLLAKSLKQTIRQRDSAQNKFRGSQKNQLISANVVSWVANSSIHDMTRGSFYMIPVRCRCDFMNLHVGWFPKIGVPPNHPFEIGIFPNKNHPFGGTTILGNLHLGWFMVLGLPHVAFYLQYLIRPITTPLKPALLHRTQDIRGQTTPSEIYAFLSG